MFNSVKIIYSYAGCTFKMNWMISASIKKMTDLNYFVNSKKKKMILFL